MTAPRTSPQTDAFQSLFVSYRPLQPETGVPRTLALTHTTAAKPFSFFRSSDLDRAVQLSQELNTIAGDHPDDDSLRKVMERFHQVAEGDVELAQWGLRLFIGGRPGGDVLPMPTLRQQIAVHQRESPHLFANLMALSVKVPPSPEDALNYLRHDIDLSDHHLHWHILYQFANPHNPALQGQLFLYMHEQCLARYDTDRQTAGLPLVQPFLQWDDPEGTNSFGDESLPVNPLAPWIATVFPAGTYTDFNEGGKSPSALDPSDVGQTLSLLSQIAANIKSGKYADYNALGADLEANATSTLDPTGAGPHNLGHVSLSAVPNSPVPTVMTSPSVAMTTPIFYRWHRAIDDYGYQWQELQPAFAWSFGTPSVRLRRAFDGSNSTLSPDIILTLRSAIADIEKPGFDLGAFGEAKFGGAAFDAPADARLNASVLRTTMVPDSQMGEQRLQLQDHWVYFLRMANGGAKDAGVTVRIWLAHHDLAASRRNWIEMDKFVAVIPAGAKKVVARPGWQSTVIRAKSVGDLMQLASQDDQYDPDPSDVTKMWCECGLPYRLILPKGAPDPGARFRFMVMLTDAAEDGLSSDEGDFECGSVSFCGKNNWSWPDKKPIGFPFNRKFASTQSDPVFAALDPLSNVAWRDITIVNSVAPAPTISQSPLLLKS